MTKKILVVDDKAEIRKLLKSYFTQEGYEVVTAADGQEALFVARHEKPDVVLLDIMMPQMNGYDFLRTFSREATTPVIVLTAKVEESDKILGLELGADDYVVKPFSPRELAARVRAVLRRVEKAQQETPKILRAGEIMVDLEGHYAKVGGQMVDLTPSEFTILATLIGTPGRVFSRLELLERLQGVAYEGYERTIDVHIRNLRAKIEADPSQPRYIETVYGAGYRFAPQEKLP